MTTDERHALLIDLAEGTLTGERAADVAALLEHSAEAREELMLMRAALEGLNAAPSGTVPPHYFSDFMPRLRRRIEDGDMPYRWSIPAFAELLVRPMMGLTAAIVLVVCYAAFEPQGSSAPLYEMFHEAAMEEITMLQEDSSLLSSLTDDAATDLTLSEEAFGLSTEQYQSVSDLNNILEEQELDQIVKHLEATVTQEEKL